MIEPLHVPNAQPDAPSSRLKVSTVLVYQDCPHLRLGRAYLQSLSHHYCWPPSFTASEWKFEMLASPKLRDLAAVEAQESHLVVITTDSGSDLPESVKAWLESWCSTKPSAQGVLVVLISERVGYSAVHWPDFLYLEAMMNGCGWRLLVYATGWSPEDGDHFCLADARRVTSAGLLVVEISSETATFAQDT
jgi:hypothetical protein